MGVDLLGEGVDLLGEGVDLLGDGVDLLGDGGDPRSIAGGSSKTTVAQKGDQRLEIRKCDGPTNGRTDQLTWVGARDTCVSKNIARGITDPEIESAHLSNLLNIIGSI